MLASVDERGEDPVHPITWWVDYQIVQCQGCHTVSFRKASAHSEALVQLDSGEWEADVAESLYPARIEGRKGLGDEIYYLPKTVQALYEETHRAFANNSPVLVGIGLRALIENVCRDRQAAGTNLWEKIDWLQRQQMLTPAGTTILHKIRALGNKAAHEAAPHTEYQLSLAFNVVDHLLREVYILPTQIQEEFK